MIQISIDRRLATFKLTSGAWEVVQAAAIERVRLATRRSWSFDGCASGFLGKDSLND